MTLQKRMLIKILGGIADGVIHFVSSLCTSLFSLCTSLCLQSEKSAGQSDEQSEKSDENVKKPPRLSIFVKMERGWPSKPLPQSVQ